MFTKKKTIIISLLSALIVGVVCSIIVYESMSQSPQIGNYDLYGTYQFDIRNINNSEYLAVIPPSKSDANESEGEFQWYNNKEMLAQGTCKIDTKGFVTFYVDGKSIATQFVINKKYYFVDSSLEPQEITKTSKEPMVFTP